MLPAQCKAARALSGLDLRALATLALVSPDTISRFERGDELKPRTVAAIRAALESAVIFIDNGDGPGVKMRKPKQTETDK
jgi:transcriptional regulator with XRE-family HTH domain